MRKFFIIQFITILAALSLSAQERSDFNAVTDPITKEPAVVSGHSIQLSIFGLEYSYEQPLGGYWSIIIQLDGDREIIYLGENDYPPYYLDVRKLLKSYTM